MYGMVLFTHKTSFMMIAYTALTVNLAPKNQHRAYIFNVHISLCPPPGNTQLVIEDIAMEGSDTLLPLTVQRQYSAYIHKRRTSGPMGMGWILPWL